MSTITCYECKKTYNYAEDGFCPRCGSFNQPRRGSYIVSPNGDIIRADGINEAGHTDSFVHKEYHTEERQRQRLGLDRITPEQAAKAAAKKGALAGRIFMVIWFAAVALVLFSVISGIM